jgi:carotenoid cleavage dioxygenase-like enzyme
MLHCMGHRLLMSTANFARSGAQVRVNNDAHIETLERQTYGGQLRSPFTAHPKIDPKTGVHILANCFNVTQTVFIWTDDIRRFAILHMKATDVQGRVQIYHLPLFTASSSTCAISWTS